MANDRTYLICNGCGRGLVFYAWGAGAYARGNGPVADPAELDTFLNVHLECHARLDPALNAEPFRLATESLMTPEAWEAFVHRQEAHTWIEVTYDFMLAARRESGGWET